MQLRDAVHVASRARVVLRRSQTKVFDGTGPIAGRIDLAAKFRKLLFAAARRNHDRAVIREACGESAANSGRASNHDNNPFSNIQKIGHISKVWKRAEHRRDQPSDH